MLTIIMQEIMKLVAMIVPNAEITEACKQEIGRYKYNIDVLGNGKVDYNCIAMILARHGYGGLPDDNNPGLDPDAEEVTPKPPAAAVVDDPKTEPEKEEATEEEPPADTGMKEGDKVIALYRKKPRTGVFVEACGGNEEGKLRIKLDSDDAKYREIPAENVKLKG